MAKCMFHDKYFQGILQLRDCNKEIVKFVEELVEKEDRRDIYISRKVKVRTGVDLYFTSNKFLRKTGKVLKEEFGGDLKESEKLFSKNNQTGKNIYRLTVMFRYCPVKKGDIIEVKGKKYKVMFVGKSIQASEVENGKKAKFSFDEVTLQ